MAAAMKINRTKNNIVGSIPERKNKKPQKN